MPEAMQASKFSDMESKDAKKQMTVCREHKKATSTKRKAPPPNKPDRGQQCNN
jgi:hypothetical protein